MNYAVKTENLTKRYKTTLAVDSVNIQVPEGSCCGFLGKNGAGKTTSIKMIVGLIRPTSGSISMQGQAQVFGQKSAASFGYLPDVPDFYGYMTGEEFLNLCAKICNIPSAEAKDRVKQLLKTVGLDNTRTRIAGYSRGMRQRLGIAQAMINNPKVIFMDEPMSALDPMGRHDVAEIIKGLKGTTVIFSTHILGDVENVCDYILIIEKGKIVAQDTMENLRIRHSESTAKIKFYQQQEALQFFEKAQNTDAGFVATLEDEPGTLLLTATNAANGLESLSRTATNIVAANNLAMESFAAHTPSLQEIFNKEVANA